MTEFDVAHWAHVCEVGSSVELEVFIEVGRISALLNDVYIADVDDLGALVNDHDGFVLNDCPLSSAALDLDDCELLECSVLEIRIAWNLVEDVFAHDGVGEAESVADAHSQFYLSVVVFVLLELGIRVYELDHEQLEVDGLGVESRRLLVGRGARVSEYVEAIEGQLGESDLVGHV